jgi:uncharacterized protein YjdB
VFGGILPSVLMPPASAVGRKMHMLRSRVWAVVAAVAVAAGVLVAVAPAVSAAAATAQSCSHGSGGPDADALCWLDFSGYSDAAATSSAGQQFTAALGGGFTLAYTLKRTSSPGDWAPWASSPTPIVYTDAFGNDAYTGVSGEPALYPTASKLDDGVRDDIRFVMSDIAVTGSGGRAVSGYSFSIADAETLNDSESYTLTTDGAAWQVEGKLSTRPVCGNGLTGVGTATLTCTGPDESTVDVGDLVAKTAGDPTRISLTSSVLHGREGFTFAIDTTGASVVPIRVTGVSVTPAASTILVGGTQQLAATVAPAGADDTSVAWSSSNTAIATVDANGKVTGKSPGAVVITAKTADGGKTDTATVTVKPIPVSGVSVAPASSTILVGGTQQLTATVSPAGAADKAVTWSSSNTAVATVDATGKVTGKTPGAVTITVKTADGGKTATAKVTVNAIPVAGVTVAPVSSTILVGGTQQLAATVLPPGAGNKAVGWSSSNTAVATVDANGKVTGKAPGTVTITVRTLDGGKSATATVTVKPVPVTSVTVAPSSSTILVGRTQQLTATVLPPDAANRAVTWSSSNTAVATVDANGKVAGSAPGTVSITAKTVDGGKSATATVTVKPVPVASVTVAPASSTILVGRAQQLTATVLPQDAANRAVTWSSSNTAVVTVDANGKVVGKAPGTATITVRTLDGGKSATATVTVKPVPVASVTLSPASSTILVGHVQQLTATVLPSDAANKKVTWVSSNVKVATVDATGRVTGSAPGSVTITVKTADGGKTATAKVTVKPVPVASVTVAPKTSSFLVGQMKQLTATVLPADAGNRNVTWASSDTKIATVDAAGKVTGHRPGTVTITVKTADGGKTATAKVTVLPIRVTGVAATPSAVLFPSGATRQLTGTVAPSNATNKAVTWASSNAAVVTVTASGLITGHRPGTAVVTVKTVDGGKSATVRVTVAPSVLAMTGATSIPSSYARGHQVQVAGDVTSNYALTNVTASIIDRRTGRTAWSRAASPGTLSFDVSVWDTGYVFADLEPGAYRYTVTAADSSGATKTLQASDFGVTPPTTLSFAAGTVFPTTAGVVNAIKPGASPRIEGDVFSDYPLTSVTVEILTSGGAVEYEKSGRPGRLDFDIHVWQSGLLFGRLVPGSYRFVVTAADATGRSGTFEDTSFTVLQPSTLKLVGGTVFGSFAGTRSAFVQGAGVKAAGVVSSNYRFTGVTATIRTQAGKIVYSRTGGTGATRLDLASWAAALPFGRLAPGKYVYAVTASDVFYAPQVRTLQSTAFTVMPPSTLHLSGAMTVPAVLVQGHGVTVTGTVSSNYTLTNVTARVTTATGAVVYTQTANPKSTRFDLHTWNNALAFSRLPVGVYLYQVTATDSSGGHRDLVDILLAVASAPVASVIAQSGSGGAVSLTTAPQPSDTIGNSSPTPGAVLGHLSNSTTVAVTSWAARVAAAAASAGAVADTAVAAVTWGVVASVTAGLGALAMVLSMSGSTDDSVPSTNQAAAASTPATPPNPKKNCPPGELLLKCAELKSTQASDEPVGGLKKLNEKYLEQILREGKQGDPHGFKAEYVGQANVSKWNVYIDKVGQLFLQNRDGVLIATGVFR